MNKLTLVLLASLLGYQANAATVTAEFTWCSQSPQYVCALVYESGSPTEMSVTAATEQLEQSIVSLIGPSGRSLALNVQGQIQKVGGMWGEQYGRLHVTALGSAAGDSKPR